MIASFKTERDVAVQAAKAAGRLILEYRGKFAVQWKGPNDAVTDADRAAQETIFKMIERRFPDDGIMGEETQGVSRESASRRWVVDPIDGTANYIHGLPFFCVSIACCVDGSPVVGVIYDPVRQECFSAAKGEGANCNGAAIHASKTPQLENSMICGGLPADLRANRRSLEAFVQLAERNLTIRRLGSAALALAYVAAGRSDAFFAHKVEAWDVAAGALLVEEAGGKATHLSGEPYTISNGNILGTNGLIHAEMLQAVA